LARKTVSARHIPGAKSQLGDNGFVQDTARRLLSHYGRHLLVIFVVVLLVHDVFGPHGFLVMRRKQQEIQKVNATLDQLNKENAALEEQIKDLKTDPQTIRKIAREELGLAQPGEIVIKLPSPPPENPPAKP
jgi:cell division protein FtsB